MRGTGGNRFIPGDASQADLLAAIARGLDELRAWAHPERRFDLGAITVDTKRVGDRISVTVTGDLQDPA